jgi:hypothetical protein
MGLTVAQTIQAEAAKLRADASQAVAVAEVRAKQLEAMLPTLAEHATADWEGIKAKFEGLFGHFFHQQLAAKATAAAINTTIAQAASADH